MIIQLFNKNITKVLTVFSISPGSRFQRKELKEKTGMNNVNLDDALSLLLNSSIIKREKRFFYLNFEDSNGKELIGLVSRQYKALREVPLKVYFAIIELIYSLSKFEVDAYLFGSYAKLVYEEDSDIDIAIISDKVSAKGKRAIGKFIGKLEAKYKKSIEVHYFSREFYKNKKDPLVKDILKNGIKLM